MDFGFTAENDKLRQEVRQFIRENATPELRAEARTMGEGGQAGPLMKEVQKKLDEKGWLGMSWPKEYGGQEADRMDQFIVEEEFVRSRSGLGMGGNFEQARLCRRLAFYRRLRCGDPLNAAHAPFFAGARALVCHGKAAILRRTGAGYGHALQLAGRKPESLDLCFKCGAAVEFGKAFTFAFFHVHAHPFLFLIMSRAALTAAATPWPPVIARTCSGHSWSW